jgi:hypothetical protein
MGLLDEHALKMMISLKVRPVHLQAIASRAVCAAGGRAV